MWPDEKIKRRHHLFLSRDGCVETRETQKQIIRAQRSKGSRQETHTGDIGGGGCYQKGVRSSRK